MTGEIPGVVEDPDGWETLDPVKISGEAFGQRQVEAEYTVSATHILKSFHGLNVVQLSLAKPLSYTRGSIIPLSLSIQCADEQVLDLLSASSSPNVKLLCNLHYTSRVKGKQGADRPPTAVHGPIDASYYAEFRATQGAVWWKPGSQPSSGSARHLRGEIHIAPGLKPGLLTPEFRLFVSHSARLLVARTLCPADAAFAVHCWPVCARCAFFRSHPRASTRGRRPAHAARRSGD
jgi:hypothetical protein